MTRGAGIQMAPPEPVDYDKILSEHELIIHIQEQMAEIQREKDEDIIQLRNELNNQQDNIDILQSEVGKTIDIHEMRMTQAETRHDILQKYVTEDFASLKASL